jgi:hypothetical protein
MTAAIDFTYTDATVAGEVAALVAGDEAEVGHVVDVVAGDR